MGTEMTAEMVADASESTPSDTPLTKLLVRPNHPSASDAEALRSILTLVETLLREHRTLRATRARITLELFAAALFLIGIASFTLPSLHTWVGRELGVLIFAAMSVVVAFMATRIVTLRHLSAERSKNERLSGKAVEFVREYAALTRVDRGPAEEAELQLRLEQIGIEPLDRPM